MGSVIALGQSSSIRDIDIRLVLGEDGTANITETWDITVSQGTEWYLNRENLGDITISDFSVSDENGRLFKNTGSWDVDRSREDKAGKCGIVSKRNGYELCWGIGDYGHHIYTVVYKMHNAAKSLNDYDMLHMQLVSPGLSARPEHVKVTISIDNEILDEGNTRIWGFGYEGTMTFQDGKAVAESDREFRSNSSVIALLRFEKGMIEPTSVQDRDFQDVLDIAMEGADFGDDSLTKGELFMMFLSTIGFFAFMVWLGKKIQESKLKSIIGVKKLSLVDWERDVPFSGNIEASSHILHKVSETGALGTLKSNNLAAALILRMIQDSQILVRTDLKGKVELAFNDDADFSNLTPCAMRLYQMMKEASGKDVILQEKEFSAWSNRNKKRVSKWVDDITVECKEEAVRNNYTSRNSSSSEGQSLARKVMGFKKFLEDFTLVKERQSQEVALWNDYLTFASLYGIADKVAKELKDIDPKKFTETTTMDPQTYWELTRMSNRLGYSITNADAAHKLSQSQKAAGGFGGHSSFGGGGGFSGGGFGGGAR